jgi:hypothetical protein
VQEIVMDFKFMPKYLSEKSMHKFGENISLKMTTWTLEMAVEK